jgi:hypothetical protein
MDGSMESTEHSFDRLLRDFVRRLHADASHPRLANLCTRLDYNNFSSLSTGDGT